jgi:hypothetical protein
MPSSQLPQKERIRRWKKLKSQILQFIFLISFHLGSYIYLDSKNKLNTNKHSVYILDMGVKRRPSYQPKSLGVLEDLVVSMGKIGPEFREASRVKGEPRPSPAYIHMSGGKPTHGRLV